MSQNFGLKFDDYLRMTSFATGHPWGVLDFWNFVQTIFSSSVFTLNFFSKSCLKIVNDFATPKNTEIKYVKLMINPLHRLKPNP